MLQLPSSGNNGGYKWIVNVLTGDTGSGSGDGSLGLSQGVIAAIVIVCAVAVLLILFILYRFRHRVKRFLFRLHYDFWKPRFVFLLCCILHMFLVNIVPPHSSV